MKSTIVIGKYELQIDLDLTREMYLEMPRISEICSCTNCKILDETIDRNYEVFHQGVSRFGIQINKSPEIFEQYRSEDGVAHYMGIFHIVGQIVAGPDCWKPVASGKQLNENAMIPFDHGSFGFTREVVLASKKYRHEVFQMEMLLDVSGLPTEVEPSI